MNKFRFYLPIVAMLAILLPMVACDDNDEPNKGNNIDRSIYYGDTIIYIDETTEEGMLSGVKGLKFTEESLSGHYVIIRSKDYSLPYYEIYIPNSYTELDLVINNLTKPHIALPDYLTVNEEKIAFVNDVETYGGKLNDYTYFSSETDCLTMIYDKDFELSFKISANPDNDERRLGLVVGDGRMAGANILFIQEGKR